jgi:hypothetical protein
LRIFILRKLGRPDLRSLALPRKRRGNVLNAGF